MKIFVVAKTNAREDLVEKIDEQHFKVATRELPIKGRANLAIIALLADYFKVGKSDITIVSGFSKRNKIFNLQI